MSYKNVVICDRCGKEKALEISRTCGPILALSGGWKSMEHEHVCPECYAGFKAWIKEKPPESAEK